MEELKRVSRKLYPEAPLTFSLLELYKSLADNGSLQNLKQSLNSFRRELAKIDEKYNGYEQQDAFELLGLIINKMDSEMIKVDPKSGKNLTTTPLLLKTNLWYIGYIIH